MYRWFPDYAVISIIVSQKERQFPWYHRFFSPSHSYLRNDGDTHYGPAGPLLSAHQFIVRLLWNVDHRPFRAIAVGLGVSGVKKAVTGPEGSVGLTSQRLQLDSEALIVATGRIQKLKLAYGCVKAWCDSTFDLRHKIGSRVVKVITSPTWER